MENEAKKYIVRKTITAYTDPNGYENSNITFKNFEEAEKYLSSSIGKELVAISELGKSCSLQINMDIEKLDNNEKRIILHVKSTSTQNDYPNFQNCPPYRIYSNPYNFFDIANHTFIGFPYNNPMISEYGQIYGGPNDNGSRYDPIKGVFVNSYDGSNSPAMKNKKSKKDEEEI